MSRKSVWARSVAVLALVAAFAVGCGGRQAQTEAPLPPAKNLQASDLASLAGEWQGTLRGVGSSGPLPGRTANARVTVAPDGSFTTNIDGVPGQGKGRIEGGRILFEGSTTRGTATLHEGGGRRVIVGEGTWLGFPGNSAFQLTKR
jgi:hypothetical protein